MRILLLTSFDLFPPVHGGSGIAYNFVKHASERHEVTALLSRLYSRGGDPDLTNANLHIEYCRRSVFDHLRVLSFLANPYYYRAAERLCLASQPDVVQCESLWPALAVWHLRRRCGVPWVCVTYNVEADKFTELRRPAALVTLVDAVERFVYRRADAVVTVSERDRQRLIQRYGGDADRLHTIAPSPDLSEFRFDAQSRAAVRERYGLSANQAMLTFVGNLKYEPNRDAVRRIASETAPAVLAEHPDALFVIIGQGNELLVDCRHERMTFTGYLDRPDLVAHLCATDVFLVPVETGSGIRIKIPEATACGGAVVATRKAAAGLELFRDDEIVRVQDAGSAFSAAVLRLLRDPAARRAIGARAQARTRSSLGWARTLTAYEDVYAGIGAKS